MSKNGRIPKDNTNATILLVEDEALIALDEAAMLEKNGFTVISAYTGEKAVELAKTEKIDFVLMDIDLGKDKMDGTETAELILQDRDLPIVFCTNHNEKETVERVKGITRYGYVLKNSGDAVIIEAIQTAFELHSLYLASKEKNDLSESEEKYRAIFDLSPDGIAIGSLSGRVLHVNRAFCLLTGFEEKDFIGKHFTRIPTRVNQRMQAWLQLFSRMIKGEIHKPTQFQWMHKSGEIRIGEARSRIIYPRTRPAFLMVILRDITEQIRSEKTLKESEEKYRRAAEDARLEITERKKTEEQLKETIAEKEFLMKEMNHRIKNNLAIITSLIRMKTSLGENKEDLSDIVHQIDAIRLVHEKLYQSKDVSRIQLKSYIQDLLETIFSTFSKHPVTLVNNIDSTTLKTRDAITIGLIINEIATNAVKYGFPNADDPVFTVELESAKNEDQHTLRLSNTGPPFPEEIDFNNPGTLGLRLIHTLVGQLGGDVELTKEPHPLYTIFLPSSF
jgi:PAS domain S-box-containing protein